MPIMPEIGMMKILHEGLACSKRLNSCPIVQHTWSVKSGERDEILKISTVMHFQWGTLLLNT